MIIRGGTMHPISEWPPDPERHKFDGDIRPIADYPKDRHQGMVILFCPQEKPYGWRIGSWNRAANVWLQQQFRGEPLRRLTPTHFTPLPGDSIELFDS